jgi:hypothetical protein
MKLLLGRRVRVLLAPVVAAAGLAVAAPPALAVDPDTFADDPDAGVTLREAIAATPGGTVTLQAGTYQLQSPLDVTAAVTIDGAGMDQTVVRGSGTSGVFGIAADVALADLTVTNGRRVSPSSPETGTAPGGGGILVGTYGATTAAHLVASRVKVTGNAANQGGGIYVTLTAPDRSSATLTDSVIVGNTATAFGGGLSAFGDVTLTRTAVVGNGAKFGGGLNLWANPQSTLTASNVTIGGNEAGENGGGLISGGRLDFEFSTIAANKARGGTNFLLNGGGVTIGGSLLAGGGDTCRYGAGGGAFTSRGFNVEQTRLCLKAPLATDRVNTGADALALLPLDLAAQVYWFRLGPPSLARDTGPEPCALTVDQRNQPRPRYDRCDVGAIEEETVPVPPTPTPTPSPTPSPAPRPSPTPRPTATPTPTPFPTVVFVPTPTPTASGGVGGDVQAGGLAARITTSGRARAVRRGRRVTVRTGLTVRCPAGGAACSATVRLRPATGRTTLGSARVRVAAGGRAALTVRLSGASAEALRGSGARVRIAVTVRRTDATDVSRSRTVRLRA